MSITTKISWLFAAVTAVFAVVLFIVLRQVVLGSFLILEHTEAVKDAQRWSGGLTAEIQDLGLIVKDWSNWDDVCAFVGGENDQFLADYLSDHVFELLQVDLLAIVDTQGNVKFMQSLDRDTLEPTGIAEFATPDWADGNPLFVLSGVDSIVEGIIQTSGGPMLVSGRPILSSEGLGPVRGALVMGRLLDQAVQDDISERTLVTMRRIIVGEPQEPELAAVWQRIQQPDSFDVVVRSPAELDVYSFYPDISGQSGLLLDASVNRHVSQQGQRAMLLIVGAALGSGFLLTIVLLLFLHTTVIRRLARLSAFTQTVAKGSDLELRYAGGEGDEIGVLGRDVNLMLEKLSLEQAAKLSAERRESEMRAITSMTATYAHEINNPLAVVNSFVNMLIEDEEENSERMEMLVEVDSAAKRIQSAVEKMQQITEPSYKKYSEDSDIIDLDNSQ